MSQAATSLDEQRLCPACGYDLRANTTPRCPECGTLAGRGSVSRLPWVHRRHRGRREAFLTTLWLILFHPRSIAAEMSHRIDRVDARGFHREALTFSTLVITGSLILAFLMRGPQLERHLFPGVFWLGAERTVGVPRGPFYVLMEGLWSVVPLLLTVWISLQLTMALYRGMLWWAAGWKSGAGRSRVWMRRRAVALGYYATALAPVSGVLFGLLLMCIVASFDITHEIGRFWQWMIWVGICVLPLASGAVIVFPTVILLRSCGVGWARGIFISTFFALLQIALWAAVGACVFWGIGYALIMAWSMMN